MSAITGIYHLSGRPAERVDLERMLTTLAHRGPDASGVWSRGSVGLGHRMLRTTPESLHEQLPLTARTGDFVITADARIDNRTELIADLGFAGYPAAHVSDGQLILAAYEKWGEQCPERLLGDFAFSIWDHSKRELFCARDHFGVKPFYYYYRAGHAFIFASEIKGILCLPEAPRQLNELRVAEHLVPVFEDKAITFYRDIFRLPAAHRVRVSPKGMSLSRFWSLDPTRELRLRSNAEYAEGLREVFTEAVRCRLRSTSPVGSMLSGGLDSSSIVCTARNVLTEGDHGPLHTFSAVFPSLAEVDRRIDERSYIDAVLAADGLEPHYVRADRHGPLAEILWGDDEAIPAPNLYMDCALFDAARQAGVRVLFSGWDGDSTVSHGYEYFPELVRQGKWGTLFTEATALSQRLAHRRATPRRLIWRLGVRPLVPESFMRVWRRLHGRRRLPVPIIGPIHPAFARRIRLEERLEALLADEATPTRNAREDHYRSLTAGILVYGLELLDKAAARYSLDLRYPFCDRRVIEFCLSLPPEQKLQQGWDRAVMRRAMKGVLPQAVEERVHKGDLSANFKRRLLADGRETLERVILHPPQIIEEYVDVSILRGAYEQYAADPLRREGEALAVLLAVTLALWLGQTGLTA